MATILTSMTIAVMIKQNTHIRNIITQKVIIRHAIMKFINLRLQL
ncbi:MAG: hypothetical protein VW125_08050 [Flavobacteriaceae bacterium]